MSKFVFFSFHYQDVIDFRANVVRNHKTTKHTAAGYFDASIWESAKKTGEIALKRMINQELAGTTVTAVLIGSQTYSRRWVRYEIMKSFEKGNKLIGIHINSITGKDGRIKTNGPNPFDYLGVKISENGKKISLIEKTSEKWQYYKDLDGWTSNNAPSQIFGKSYTLRNWLSVETYDWTIDGGYNNFTNWIN